MNDRPDPRLLVQPAPFLRPNVSTPGIMNDVLVALVPSLAAALWFFGISALLVTAAATAAVAFDDCAGGEARPDPTHPHHCHI